jgi:NAD(P)H-quinone oxidoreductase subunit 5
MIMDHAVPGLVALPVASAAMIAFVLGDRHAALVARLAQIAAAVALIGAIALTARVDAVAAVMLVLVTFIGFIVVRYSESYLRAEPGQSRFIGWLCATLGSVIALVGSGSLPVLIAAWIATSLFLHRLLLFYPDRRGAQRAARKKFVTARIGDAALIGAALCLWLAYRTGNIAAILAEARAGAGGMRGGACVIWTARPGMIALSASRLARRCMTVPQASQRAIRLPVVLWPMMNSTIPKAGRCGSRHRKQ